MPSGQDISGENEATDQMTGKPRQSQTRRAVLGVLGTAALGGVTTPTVVTASTDNETEQPDDEPYNGYLSEEGTWGEETADAGALDEVRIEVGAPGNGGDFAFNPAAVVVGVGTDIIWEWTGNGGPHNVVHDPDGHPEQDEQRFNSDDVTDQPTPAVEGTTFEWVAESPGFYPYVCEPHESIEMKGVIVVGRDAVETSRGEYDVDPVEEEDILVSEGGDDSSDGFGPGFAGGGALTALGGLSYWLYGRRKNQKKTGP